MDTNELFESISESLSRHGYEWQVNKKGLFKVNYEKGQETLICNFIVVPKFIEKGSGRKERYIGGEIYSDNKRIEKFYAQDDEYSNGHFIDAFISKNHKEFYIAHGKRNEFSSYLKNILNVLSPKLENNVIVFKTSLWKVTSDDSGYYSISFSKNKESYKAKGILINNFFYSLTENYKFIFAYMLYCKMNSLVYAISKEPGKNLNIVADFENPNFDNFFSVMKILLSLFKFEDEPILVDVEYPNDLIRKLFAGKYDRIICFAEKINQYSNKDLYKVLNNELKTNGCNYRYISISDFDKDDKTFININLKSEDYGTIFTNELDGITYFDEQEEAITFHGMDDEEVSKMKYRNIDFFRKIFDKEGNAYPDESKVFLEKIVNTCDKSRLKEKDYELYAHIYLIMSTYLEYIATECLENSLLTGIDFLEWKQDFYDILRARMYKPINENILIINKFLKQIHDKLSIILTVDEITEDKKDSIDMFICKRFGREKIGIVRTKRTEEKVDFLRSIQTGDIKDLFELDRSNNKVIYKRYIGDVIDTPAFFLDIEKLDQYIKSLEIE
ncbi:hypothetical protein [Aminipila terrae]|uniref:Uncharacterized protein n=1 Tax=Aminipila terrae TaxID=2697030 RepID=A0A6P1MIP7_9FIRM|nr:hypothetical protein [Aminipila terrae]QHI73063.1 hypothetical protein Ami3637_12230 [Aminipila terrae]